MQQLRDLIWKYDGKEISELKGIDKFLSDGKLSNGRTKLKINPEFQTAYQKWLEGQKGNARVKTVLGQIRKSLDNDLLLVYNRMAEMREYDDTTIDKLRKSIGMVQNYFPHHRYGKYYVQAFGISKENGQELKTAIDEAVKKRSEKDAAFKARAASVEYQTNLGKIYKAIDGLTLENAEKRSVTLENALSSLLGKDRAHALVQQATSETVVYREHFDLPMPSPVKSHRKKQVEAQAAEIILKLKKEGNFLGARWAPPAENVKMPDEMFSTPIDTEAMEQIIQAATEKIRDPDDAKAVRDTLHEGVGDVYKKRGWGSHTIGRKGIPGHETEDILRVLYDYKSGLTGWLTKMEAARDFSEMLGDIKATRKPELWTYSAQYVKDMLRNSDRLDRITGNIKALAFVWYLGGSIKTAAVNATQNIIVGVPRLGMSANGSMTAWLEAAGDALVHQITGKTGSLTEDEARLMQELVGARVITNAYMEEVRGQMRGVAEKGWKKFTEILGMPMSAVERFNRASLALAAYRLARNGNLKPAVRTEYGVTGGTKADYETAKRFAKDIVRDSHFQYGKSNMPEFLRSNAAGRGLGADYTFRTFSHNILKLWTWALASQGAEGRWFVAKSIGNTVALGGLTAIPFYSTLMALIQHMRKRFEPQLE
jgi:hypothetical protein